MNEEKQPVFNLTQKTKTIIMGGCAIAAVAALFVAGAISNGTNDVAPEISTTSPSLGAEVKVTNIPDDREVITVAPTTSYKSDDMITVTEQVTVAQPQREAPEAYNLPLGTDIGKDYSRGVPVYNDVMGDWRVHNGVDFNGAYGDSVKSIASGYVKDVFKDDVMGDAVVVDHGGGVVAKYYGVTADADIKKGVYVDACDKLGVLSTIPSEKTAQFPHLHLEIEVNGETADPLEVMGLY